MRSCPITSDGLYAMQVINLCDGSCLGFPESLELSYTCGGSCGCNTCTVTALIVPCDTGLPAWLPFGRHNAWRIPWEQVECIGEDAILVRLPPDALAGCCQRPERRHKR